MAGRSSQKRQNSSTFTILNIICVAVFTSQVLAVEGDTADVVVVVSDGVDPVTGACPGQEEDISRLKAFIVFVDYAIQESYNTSSYLKLIDVKCNDTTDVVIRKVLDIITARKVTGVITMTRGQTADSIVGFLQYFQMPVVEIVSGDVITKTSVFVKHYIVPYYTYWQMELVLVTARFYNWTTLTMAEVDQGSESSHVLRSVFKRMAFDKGFCIIPTFYKSDVPIVLLNSDINVNFKLAEAKSRTILLVGEPDDMLSRLVHERNSSVHFVLYQQPVSTRWLRIADAIVDTCHLAYRNKDPKFDSGQYHDECLNFRTLGIFFLGVETYIENFFKSVSFLFSMSSFTKNTSSCNDDSRSSVQCLLLEDTDAMLDNNSNILNGTRKTFTIKTFRSYNDSLNEDDLATMQESGLMLREPISFSYILNISCDQVCNKCDQCFPSKLSPTKIMTSGDGNMFVIAFFPIHASNNHGSCAEPNMEGYLEAMIFLEAVKSYSLKRYEASVQGVVFDSCGSPNEVISKIHSLETCAFYFNEEINSTIIPRIFPPKHIIGYVVRDKGFNLPTVLTGKPLLSVQDLGYSMTGDKRPILVENILKSLLQIGWTVINVIASDQVPFRTMSEFLYSSPLSNYFCFVNKILIRSDVNHLNDDLDKVLDCKDNTSAYLLITSSHHTDQIFQRFQAKGENITAKVSFVLPPWSTNIYKMYNISAFVDIIINFKPAVKNEVINSLATVINTINTTFSPWSHEFDFSSLISTSDRLISQDVVLQGTGQFLTILQNTYKNEPKANISFNDLTFTGLNMTSLFVARDFETEVGFVDKDRLEMAQFDGPAFNSCRGWCPACNSCTTRNIWPETSFYLDGDLIIVGLFPLHKAGMKAFTCSTAQNDDVKLTNILAFMFAVDSFKMRYPDILPGLNIGGKILSTCSSSALAMKIIGDLETCSLNSQGPTSLQHDHWIKNDDIYQLYNNFGNPTKILAYLIDTSDNYSYYFSNIVQTSQLKNTIVLNGIKTALSTDTDQASLHTTELIAEILTKLSWDKFVILYENRVEFEDEANTLINATIKNGLCVVAKFYFNSQSFIANTLPANLEAYRGMPVVMLSSKEASKIVFDSLIRYKNSYFWIIPVTHKSWSRSISRTNYFPLGSIVIDDKSKENKQFDYFVQNLTDESGFPTRLSSWFKDLWRLKFSCYFDNVTVRDPDARTECPETVSIFETRNLSSTVYDVIKTVDAVLHVVHEEYVAKCPQKSGMCDKLAEDIINRRLSFTRDVSFLYKGELLDYSFEGDIISTLSVFNYQKEEVMEVGSYFKSNFSFDVTKIRLYTTDSLELSQIPRIVCASDCQCLDIASVNNSYLGKNTSSVFISKAEFITDIWAIIIVAIGGSGALLSLIFAVYVVYKVSRRALGKRYVGLGLTLLFSLTLLFLTVLPYVISPTETICSLRHLLPGFSFALSFAIVLVKLMSLRSYKLIGLGGEVSGINQFLTAFFVVDVQIAIGTLWWLTSQPVMYSSTNGKLIQMLSCNFSRPDFAAYHVYVMFLIVLCCFYGVGVRKEKKNLGEAKVLLAYSLTCLAIWVTWLLCFFLLDRKWSDVIICAAILSCATSGLLIIFIPKLRMVSKLKYDVSQKVSFRNGHSVDTDFLYERPYSLPGTLSSTFSSVKMNYPKTFSNFEADVNY